VTAATEPTAASQPVLLRLVDFGPPPEPDDAARGWRPSFVDRLPPLQPAPPQRHELTLVTEPAEDTPIPVPITRPQAHSLATMVARAVLEVLEGRRPARQLSAVFDLRALSTVQVLLNGGLREPVQRAALSSVRVYLPCARSIESSVVFRCGHRCRALALRLEQQEQRWRCTALRVG
jgi:hypothetical protein